MTYRKRRFLFFLSIVAFLIVSGPLILYTFGYRFSLADLSIRETGGVFMHTNPVGVEVTIDTLSRTTSFLTGNTFIQNLEPGPHTITVSYDGFQQWKKQIMVKPQTVTEVSALLFPIFPEHYPLEIASTTTMRMSPRGTLLFVHKENAANNLYQIYDTEFGSILPLADALSGTRMASISDDAVFFWDEDENAAIIETPADWLLLTRVNNVIRVRSLYEHSRLSDILSKKPAFIAHDPSHPAVYYILDTTNFLRWNMETEHMEQLLQSIAGFSITPTHTILWDMQNNTPYVTTLEATNPRAYGTTSIPGITQTRIIEHANSLILLDKNGLWLASEQREPLLLAKDYSAKRIVLTDAYILWWDVNNITIYWTLPAVDMPLHQTVRMETLYHTEGIIKHIAAYPGEPYIIFQENNIIYTLELDGRGGERNKHVIYEGTNPTFHVPPDENIIYILDEGAVFTIELL